MTEERGQAQLRQRNPQLRDLVSPEDVAAVRSNDKERVMAVVNKLDFEKRVAVIGLLDPKFQVYFPRVSARSRSSPHAAPRAQRRQPGRRESYRAVYSNRQLEEVLVDYWFNHFNVDSTKNVAMTGNLGQVLIGSYERAMPSRPHVLGHFKDLPCSPPPATRPCSTISTTGNPSPPEVLTSAFVRAATRRISQRRAQFHPPQRSAAPCAWPQ